MSPTSALSRHRAARAKTAQTCVLPHRTRDRRPPRAAPEPPPSDPAYIRDSYAATALAEVAGSVHPCGDRPDDRRPVADGRLRRVSRLGCKSGVLARQASTAARKGVQENDANRRLTRCPARRRRQGGACIEPLPQDHRFDDPAWRQWPFDLLCRLPAVAAVVAQRHHRDRRGEPAPRGGRGVLRAADARRRVAVELPADQSGGAGPHDARGWEEPAAGRGEPRGGLAARRRRQAAGGGRRRSPSARRSPSPAAWWCSATG